MMSYASAPGYSVNCAQVPPLQSAKDSAPYTCNITAWNCQNKTEIQAMISTAESNCNSDKESCEYFYSGTLHLKI